MNNLALQSTFMLLFLLSSYGLARAQTDCCPLDAQLTYYEDFTPSVTQIAPAYTVTTSPTGPGQIAYQNGVFANSISNGTWNVNGHSNCSPTDPMMLVNGRTTSTGGSGEARIYQSPNINLVVGENYNLCVKVKDLAQCAFNVAPEVRVQAVAVNTGMGIIVLFDSGLVPIAAGPGNCDYINIQGTFAGANTVRVRIWLDENKPGDGNDIAIDDLVVLPRPTVNSSLTQFKDSTIYAGGSQYNIIATALQALPAHCQQTWTVCELSDPNDLNTCIPSTLASSGPNGVWGSPTNFPGYCCTPNSSSPAGLFDEGDHHYLIRRTVNCDCEDPNSYIIIIKQGPESTENYYEGPESEFPGIGVEDPTNPNH